MGDGFATGGFGHRGHFVVQVFHPVAAGHALEPVKHGAAVEIAFVHTVVVGGDDVIKLVERVGGSDLGGGHVLGARPQCHLYLLVLLQRLRKLGRVREVEIAKVLQRQMRHLWIIAHKPAEILDELGPELRHLHVNC